VLIDDVIDIICEVRSELKPSELANDTQFDTLGLSSLELTEVILELEERHDVEIDISTVDAAESLKTVGDIVVTLEDLLKSKSQNPV
jgi:nodulation protein F